MAQHLGIVMGNAYQKYLKQLGFTFDPKQMAVAVKALKEHPLITKNMINKLNKIAKFNWNQYKDCILTEQAVSLEIRVLR